MDVSPNLAIYMFSTFDEYLQFCTSLAERQENTYTFLKKSSLYLYNSNYYLCITVSNKNIDLFKTLYYAIIEFATNISNPDLFERKLIEYGKSIFKTNAINNCIKYIKY